MMSGTAKLPTSLSDYSIKSMNDTKNTDIVCVFFVFLVDYTIHTKPHFNKYTNIYINILINKVINKRTNKQTKKEIK